MKIINAVVYLDPNRQPSVRVTLDKREDLPFQFESRSGVFKRQGFEEKWQVFRAQHGDFGRFFAWVGPHNEGGFGGSTFEITMLDGTTQKLLGPWSSRAGAINSVFPDHDPLVDCVTTDNYTQACTKAALEQFGIKFELDNSCGDVCYRPMLPA